MTVKKYIHTVPASPVVYQPAVPVSPSPARKLTRARTTHCEELLSRALLRSSAALRRWLARTRGAQRSIILLPNCARTNFSSVVVEILKLLLLLLMQFLVFLFFKNFFGGSNLKKLQQKASGVLHPLLDIPIFSPSFLSLM